jgi:hypothetical protein
MCFLRRQSGATINLILVSDFTNDVSFSPSKQNFELLSFASADKLAQVIVGVWLHNWEGRRVAVPIFPCKINIRKFGAETCQPSLKFWDADTASLP